MFRVLLLPVLACEHLTNYFCRKKREHAVRRQAPSQWRRRLYVAMFRNTLVLSLMMSFPVEKEAVLHPSAAFQLRFEWGNSVFYKRDCIPRLLYHVTKSPPIGLSAIRMEFACDISVYLLPLTQEGESSCSPPKMDWKFLVTDFSFHILLKPDQIFHEKRNLKTRTRLPARQRDFVRDAFPSKSHAAHCGTGRCTCHALPDNSTFLTDKSFGYFAVHLILMYNEEKSISPWGVDISVTKVVPKWAKSLKLRW